MEQQITTLEEVSRHTIEALRGFNDAMPRYYAAAERRDEAMRQMVESLDRTDGEMRDFANALERQDEAIQALLSFVPVTQAEVVRLDSMIDAIEGA